MKLSDYNFHLPSELIAQHPLEKRDQSKLLHLSDTIKDLKFHNIIDLLKEGDVLVFNDTKVIPAKLFGHIINSLGAKSKISLNLNRKISSNSWSAFAKPAKKLSVDSEIIFSDHLRCTVEEKLENGEVIIKFNIHDEELLKAINQIGKIPLPQYIRKGISSEEDVDNYQTVYAQNAGAVAAPTAGLHFTHELINRIKAKGIKIAYVTLHVGAGTFLPVKTENIEEHKMHSEIIMIDKKNAELIKSAKRVLAVGTTSVRTLESIATMFGEIKEYCGETDIFITDSYKFKVVDILITNFHLPKSTLLILVTAFAGFDKIMCAYKHAINNKYRFFSYGDACWLEKIVYE